MAETHPKFDVALVTPEGETFRGEAEMLIVPGAAGEIGVLARHAPLVATLKAGSTRIYRDRASEDVLEFATGPGFFKVELDNAIALVDDAVDVKRDRRRPRAGAARGGEGGAREGRAPASRTPTAGSSSSGSRTPRTSSRSPAAPRAMRVAALADVHGNAVALEAVLAELEREQPDLIVSCGDLTWGPLPLETVALLEPWRERLLCVQRQLGAGARRAEADRLGDRALGARAARRGRS